MPSFDDLGLEPGLVALLTEAGITAPFPVQEATLPDALAGHDVCAKAPTGSGKTLAYGLALLQRCGSARPRSPRALILVPTRELAKQVAEVLMPYGRTRRRWVTAFFGGAGMMRQIADLQRGVDVAVATPGRLTDLVNRGEASLADVDLVVIDEADRMADMGFTPQVTWLLDRCAGQRQTLLYSATLDGDVDHLVRTYLHEPRFHEIAGPDGEEDEAASLKRATHLRVQTRHETKYQDLAYLVDPASRAIVFVKNRFATERVADALDDLGIRAVAMHGGMTQSARERALERWSEGAVKALVATDVAARGVHVDGVELVVHVDPPQDEKDYIHRSGRTARAGAHGVVVSMLRKEQQRGADAMFRRLGVSVDASDADSVRALVTSVRSSIEAAAPKVRISPSRGSAAVRGRGARDRVIADRDRGPVRSPRSAGSEGPRAARPVAAERRVSRPARDDAAWEPRREERGRDEGRQWSPRASTPPPPGTRPPARRVGGDGMSRTARTGPASAGTGRTRQSDRPRADRDGRARADSGAGPADRGVAQRGRGEQHGWVAHGPSRSHAATGPGHRGERPLAPGHRPVRPAWTRSAEAPTARPSRPRDARMGDGPLRRVERSAMPGARVKPRGVPRFDDADRPLNRKARRLLQFGSASGDAVGG